jgi:hypothetical protein
MALRRVRPAFIIAATLIGIGGAVFEYRRTAGERGALRTFAQLIAAANRRDLSTVESLCSSRLLLHDPPRFAPRGGLVGLPRALGRRYVVRHVGDFILISPGGRGGFEYRLVDQDGAWKFDGVVDPVFTQ